MVVFPRFHPAASIARIHSNSFFLLVLLFSVFWTNSLLSSAFFVFNNVVVSSRLRRGPSRTLSTSSRNAVSPFDLVIRPSNQLGRTTTTAAATTTTTVSTGDDSSSSSSTTSRRSMMVQDLKQRLFELSDRTNRGFKASSNDQRLARTIIYELATFNPTPEPAKDYYDSAFSTSSSTTTATSLNDGTTISGKWTLIYTDAPDITSLDTTDNPFIVSTAQLGRIGQECSAPYIKNVIEWTKPKWASNLPFSGSDQSRILQKVVTSAMSSPQTPLIVNLKVAGLELVAGDTNQDPQKTVSSGTNRDDVWTRFQKDGLPVGFLSMNPIDLKGPFNPPFGQFEVLYLDDDVRMIRTNQNFLAVNRRIVNTEDEWF